MLRPVSYPCAHCGEIQEIGFDPTAGRAQKYVEDCWVCCSPNELTLIVDDDLALAVTVEPAS